MSQSSAPPADALAAFLSGKRASARHTVALDAVLLGPELEVPVRMVDLSIGGTLIAIREKDLPDTERDDPMRHLALIERHFREGFDLRVLSSGVVVEADLIRLTLRPGEEGYIFLGCRFRVPLSRRQQRDFGIATEEILQEDVAWEEVLSARDLPLVPGPGATRWIMLYDGSTDIAGPRFAAEVTALGKQGIVCRLPGADLTEVSDRLHDATWIGCRLVRQGKTLWQTQARLIAARYFEGADPGVELFLETRGGPSRSARRGYRKALPTAKL